MVTVSHGIGRGSVNTLRLLPSPSEVPGIAVIPELQACQHRQSAQDSAAPRPAGHQGTAGRQRTQVPCVKGRQTLARCEAGRLNAGRIVMNSVVRS